MRYYELDVDPHQPEMPDTRCVVASKERCQPMELHRLLNRPACSDRKKAGDRNREVCCALEGVVLCVKARVHPLAARQLSEGKTEVVSEHPERIKQIGPAGQQGAPASSPDLPCNVHSAIQHEQIRAQPMQAQGKSQHAWAKVHVVVNPVGGTAVV